MKNFFQNLGYRMQGWMQGRYGYDELSRTLSIAALVCALLSGFIKNEFFYSFALVLCVWSIFRSFSKNIEKRREEREAYLRLTGRMRSWFSLQKRRWEDRKTHRYYRCRQCKTTLRVPKGKGKIQIRCPKCGSEITKTT